METVTFEERRKEMGGAWLPGVCRGQKTSSAKTLGEKTPGWLEPSEEEGQESELISANWACALSCVPTTPARPHLALSWGKRKVLLGKVLSFSEPQFLHLSNGLVIPFLHGRHEGT